MKKITLLWMAFICFPLLLKAQDLKVLERLDADKITTGNTLYLRKDGKIIRYYKNSTNSDDDNALNKDDIIGLTVSNKMINLKMAFYNPLQYKVKVSSIYIDDPFTKSYDQFLDAFSKTFGAIITPTKDTPTIKLISAASNVEKAQLNRYIDPITGKTFNSDRPEDYKVFVLTPTGDYVPFKAKPRVKTVLLKDWYYQVLNQKGYNADLDNALFKNTLTLEAFLYSKVKIDKEQKAIDDWIKDEAKKLYDIDDYSEFKKEIEIAKRLSDSLSVKYEYADAAQKELIRQIKTPTSISTDDNFISYSQNTIDELEIKIIPLLKSKKEKIDEFIRFANKLDRDVAKQYPSNSGALDQRFGNLGNIAMQRNQDASITVSFTKIDLEGKDLTDEAINLTFTVIKYTTGVVNFSTGFVLTDLSFPNYSTATDANGQMTIQQDLPTKKRIMPAVFLNFYSKLPYPDLYLILPQIGISTGNEYPSLLLGTGLAIGNRFSLSFGGLLTFAKDLTKYSVGETIKKQSDLENDLSYKYKVKGYISLSYRLGKK